MKNGKCETGKNLLYVNLLVCLIILAGFFVISVIGYNMNIAKENAALDGSRFLVLLLINILIIFATTAAVLIVFTVVIKCCNKKITALTVSQELEYKNLLHKATEGLYDDMYELDITNNRASGENTKNYFKSLGISANTPYDEALHVISKKQIKKEYVQGYINTFCTASVIAAYQSGISNLNYDLMITDDGETYRWIRISAQIFYWLSDNSIRMITFRKNIDAEKRLELSLLESVQRDSMTQLYNKRSAEDLISDELITDKPANGKFHALLILDIDNFKNVNDTMGHSFGDNVICKLSKELKAQFRAYDILGRIGGDEFVVLMKNLDGIDFLKQKLLRLCSQIGTMDFGSNKLFVTCSIGVALFPEQGTTYAELYEKADQALYHAKSHGKNFFVIFDELIDNNTLHVNHRDLEALVNITTDGLAQYACTNPLKLLNFNQKCVDLFGIPAEILSSPDYDPLKQIHPEDVEEVRNAIIAATKECKPFVRVFRVRHHCGNYISVKLRGVFIRALYKDKYPVFYVMYTKQ